MIEVTYADQPILHWDDGTLTGDDDAVAAVNARVAAGGTVGTPVPTVKVEAGLGDSWQAYNTICDALNGGYWGGHYTVIGDIDIAPLGEQAGDIY